MSEIENFISERGIVEVLHFTSRNGLVGVLEKRGLLPHDEMLQDDLLKYLRAANTPRVRDSQWRSHCSLSISRINLDFFNFSQRCHPDWAWRILSFSPEILTHPGVVFVTTNNIYPAAIRDEGIAGLQRLYADPVRGKYSVKIDRTERMNPSFPTDRQAEALYPGRLSTEYLRAIYVREPEEIDYVRAKFAQTEHHEVSVIAEPYRFE